MTSVEPFRVQDPVTHLVDGHTISDDAFTYDLVKELECAELGKWYKILPDSVEGKHFVPLLRSMIAALDTEAVKEKHAELHWIAKNCRPVQFFIMFPCLVIVNKNVDSQGRLMDHSYAPWEEVYRGQEYSVRQDGAVIRHLQQVDAQKYMQLQVRMEHDEYLACQKNHHQSVENNILDVEAWPSQWHVIRFGRAYARDKKMGVTLLHPCADWKQAGMWRCALLPCPSSDMQCFEGSSVPMWKVKSKICPVPGSEVYLDRHAIELDKEQYGGSIESHHNRAFFVKSWKEARHAAPATEPTSEICLDPGTGEEMVIKEQFITWYDQSARCTMVRKDMGKDKEGNRKLSDASRLCSFEVVSLLAKAIPQSRHVNDNEPYCILLCLYHNSGPQVVPDSEVWVTGEYMKVGDDWFADKCLYTEQDTREYIYCMVPFRQSEMHNYSDISKKFSIVNPKLTCYGAFQQPVLLSIMEDLEVKGRQTGRPASSSHQARGGGPYSCRSVPAPA